MSLRSINVLIIIDQFNLRNFISSTCKVPDHTILSVSLSLFKDYQMRTSVKTYVENTPTKKRRIYDFNSVSLQFLDSSDMLTSLEDIASKINILSIDELYTEFINFLKTKMNENLKYRDVNLIIKKPHKNAKPYWDNILNDLWNIMKQKEKQFRQIKMIA